MATAVASRSTGVLARPRAKYVAATSIALVGLVYSLWLRNTWDPQGLQKLADIALHDAVPVLFVGMWLALWLLPREWPWVLAAFALFRLFDVWKPWPVRWADRSLKGGFGTMVDDALAGLMAFGVLQLALALLPMLRG